MTYTSRVTSGKLLIYLSQCQSLQDTNIVTLQKECFNLQPAETKNDSLLADQVDLDLPKNANGEI